MSDDDRASTVVVAVDVGKNTVALSVTDQGRHRLLGPLDFAMTRAGLSSTVKMIQSKVIEPVVVKVGIEAAGHYHQPLMVPSSWPAGWELLELNPAHVTEQRRVQGRRRVKTDAIDLEAITELVLAGRGTPVTERAQVLGELAAWSAHRTRRVEARTALKNQLLGQLDRAFPGLTLALPDVLATKVGRLVVENSPTPPGWPLWVRHGSSGSLRHVGFGSEALSRRVWSPQHVRRCQPVTRLWPGRWSPPIERCSIRSTSRSQRLSSRSLSCCPGPRLRSLQPSPGGARSGPAPTGRPSGIRLDGPARVRSTVRRDCRRCSTSPQASAATVPSAARAASPSGAR